MKLEPGASVDRYTVEEPLGVGGTAVVYRVRHTRLGTYHALKLLTIHGESIKRRLLQEGKAQATLGHLNIVSVTDIVDVAGQPGLLMEYVEGPSLEEALLEYRLTMGDAETLFLGVVAGVRAAHERGIIHRDLKPANVLLAPTAAGFVPKVTDFGLAKAVRGPAMREGSTRQGVAMGTPSYMAPEQIRDAGKVDERADIFSLGCILYEIVSRHRAFPGEDSIDIYDNVRAGRYIPIRQLVPDLPDRVEQAIRGAMQIDRERRIPSCDVLLSVLRGDQTWDRSKDPPSFPDLFPVQSLASNIPPLTLAPREADGGTPMVAPPREIGAGGSFGVDDPTEAVEMDGTLMPYELPPDLPPVRGSGTVLAAALVTGSLGLLVVALLFALLGVGVLPVLLGSAPSAPVEQPAAVPDPAEASAPVEAEPEPEPEAPSPEPVVLARPSPAPTPVSPAPVASLGVKLFSVPMSATIFVDGKATQRRTPSSLTLSPGQHHIRMESGGRPAQFTIQVGAGKPTRWCFVFATGTAHPGRCPG